MRIYKWSSPHGIVTAKVTGRVGRAEAEILSVMRDGKDVEQDISEDKLSELAELVLSRDAAEYEDAMERKAEMREEKR